MFNRIIIELDNDYRRNTNHLSTASGLIKQCNKIDLDDRISKTHDADDQKEGKCKAKKYNHFRKSTSDPNIQHIKFLDKLPKKTQNQTKSKNKNKIKFYIRKVIFRLNNSPENLQANERFHISTS